MAEWSSIGFRLIIVSSQHVVGSKDSIILLLAQMGELRDTWSTAAPLLGAPYSHWRLSMIIRFFYSLFLLLELGQSHFTLYHKH